jgi:hypothetical protein
LDIGALWKESAWGFDRCVKLAKLNFAVRRIAFCQVTFLADLKRSLSEQRQWRNAQYLQTLLRYLNASSLSAGRRCNLTALALPHSIPKGQSSNNMQMILASTGTESGFRKFG